MGHLPFRVLVERFPAILFERVENIRRQGRHLILFHFIKVSAFINSLPDRHIFLQDNIDNMLSSLTDDENNFNIFFYQFSVVDVLRRIILLFIFSLYTSI